MVSLGTESPAIDCRNAKSSPKIVLSTDSGRVTWIASGVKVMSPCALWKVDSSVPGARSIPPIW